ncbi:MAG: LTA synthase family protein [Burkholderiaceae bacterium]|nr:LTA synthase family protein [Burkholderiaceae bacterium]
MTINLLCHVLLPGAIGWLLSLLLEGLLTPRPVAPWRRSGAAHCVHAGLWLVLYALELALFRRPVFAVLNVLAIQFLVILVSNVKYSTLREPFVYTDFEYFVDALRHPRLYLPFFGRIKAALAAAGYAVVLFTGLTMEQALTSAGGLWTLMLQDAVDPSMAVWSLPFFWAAMACLVVCGWLLAQWGVIRPSTMPTFDTGDDLRRLGLATVLWRYRASERTCFVVPERHWRAPDDGYSNGAKFAERPDIVVVQSESFFDARRDFLSIKPDVLSQFDVLNAESVAAGRLRVAAWGANTVRTEFAFLSGLEPSTLGVHRYNPYRKLARSGVSTLASHLQQHGYRTVCVHPYPASFYARDTVYPLMGFETFLDIDAFADEERFGPYVSDAAVARKIDALLGDARDHKPLFVFAITMENHGPLHWETVGPSDRTRFFDAPLSPDFDDLVAYTRHLANADAMFGQLAERLIRHDRSAVLCIYGDHVPIMPTVYAAAGEPDGLTDYVIWRPPGQGMQHAPAQRDEIRPVETLADDILHAAFAPNAIDVTAS